ncbi:hypothetical protein BI49514_02408 [Brevibacterium iodinum ATCC 49514]|uniref:Uncharacterized protein n=1 Tax=Brevibacterium iodinum ATCC 49514 TaxID=1255616 RepID=A0A2H1JVF9_9MICO|nr:hypothetical protein [Brevibacterium iodinum]SMX91515.1 hypothetical protein BI49514_02408 [Brevibacterium iodinum ATCC 49514]
MKLVAGSERLSGNESLEEIFQDAVVDWLLTSLSMFGLLFVKVILPICLAWAVLIWMLRVITSFGRGTEGRTVGRASAPLGHMESGQKWSPMDIIVARHDAARKRWSQWHTDLDLLIEFPAIHDVTNEEFAVRIIDAAEAAEQAREKWEADSSESVITAYELAVDEFDEALRTGEKQARLLGRGPSLDPVFKRVMDDAAHLVEVMRRIDTPNDDRFRLMRALYKTLKPIIGEETAQIPELQLVTMGRLTTLESD